MARYYYARPDSEIEPGPVLRELLDKIQGGDVLACPSADHVAQDWRSLKAILAAIEAKSARFEAAYSSGVHTDPPEKRFKADLRRAATARAKARGAYSNNAGRPQTVDPQAIRKLIGEGVLPRTVATRLNVGRSSVYRVLQSAA